MLLAILSLQPEHELLYTPFFTGVDDSSNSSLALS
jgi:hypothetical protein